MNDHETHVIILAAGRGSRLGELGDERPKWLLDVGDAPIAARQLDGVRQARDAGARIGSVRVVTGHAASVIDEFAAAHGDLAVETVANPSWDTLNNWYSVLVGLGSLPTADDARVVIFNADLFSRPELFAGFLLACDQTDEDALIAVDVARTLTDESMKVSAADQDGHRRLERIGKVDVEDPVGEYIGLLMFRGGALADLTATLRGFEGDPDRANEWYERGVGITAARGTRWTLWPTPDSDWVEIDDDGDYAQAVQLAASG